MFLGISNFLEEISSLAHSVVFLYFFALITEEGFLISPCYSLELWFKWICLSFSPLLFASLLFTAICKASSDSHFAFLHFFFLQMVLIPVSYTMSQTSVHSSSVTLSDLIPRICFSLPLYNHKGFDLDHTWIASDFPYFLQLKSEFGNKEFMIWAWSTRPVSSWFCFCWLYRTFPPLAAKNIINLISVLTIWWCPSIESSLVLLEQP